MNATRRPDQWVRTTCGYCAVGCGMLVGVRANKAIEPYDRFQYVADWYVNTTG